MLVDCSRFRASHHDGGDGGVGGAGHLLALERAPPTATTSATSATTTIKGCAATGGVIAVTGVGRFLGPRGPVVEHLVEHLDYMVELVGPEHVGLGMDSVLKTKPPGAPFTGNRAYWPERQYPG